MSSLNSSSFDAYLAAETLLTLKEVTDSRIERENIISSSVLIEAENSYEKDHRESNLSTKNSAAANKSSKYRNKCENSCVKSSESVASRSIRCAINACKVCGDRAKRRHYGAVTCEGCKCFFRRSVLGKCVFVCRTGFMCTINKVSRNDCGACRFVRCIDCGMVPEAVGILASKRKIATKEVKYQALIHGNTR